MHPLQGKGAMYRAPAIPGEAAEGVLRAGENPDRQYLHYPKRKTGGSEEYMGRDEKALPDGRSHGKKGISAQSAAFVCTDLL